MTSEERNGEQEPTSEYEDGSSPTLQSEDAETDPSTSRQAPSRTGEIVAGWWSDHMHGSVLAHHTEAYNHVYSRLSDLIARLEREFEG